MFEFFSKLVSRRSSNKLEEQIAAQSLQKIQNEEVKQKDKEQERREYRQKIDASAKNEEATLALLLNCDFADGRYAAAQNLYSVACLEQALQAEKILEELLADRRGRLRCALAAYNGGTKPNKRAYRYADRVLRLTGEV